MVNPMPVPTNLTTNLIGVSNKPRVEYANIASTKLDQITIGEVFYTNSGYYEIYTNNGLNTLDTAEIVSGDAVLIKDSQNTLFNGVYNVVNVHNSLHNGKISLCRRSDTFKDYGNIHNTMVAVRSQGLYGNGKGQSNPGTTWTCVKPDNEQTFVLNQSEISFITFGLQNSAYGSIAIQNHDNVSITGGRITVPELSATEIRPMPGNNEIKIRLPGQTQYDQFKVVRDDNNQELMTVDGRGIVTARDFYAPSDSRLKKNVNTIQDAIRLVRKMHGVTFDWKDYNTPYPHYGFIAQELKIAGFHSLIHERTITTPSGGVETLMTVDYAKIVSILVEAVKDIGNMLNM